MGRAASPRLELAHCEVLHTRALPGMIGLCSEPAPSPVGGEGAEVATQSYLVGQDDADVVKNGRDNEPLGQPRRTGCR